MKPIRYEKTYVAFLDILGFKELVEKNEHHVLDDIYNFNVADTIEGCKHFLKEYIYNYEYENENIEFLAVSDSIILWSNENSNMALVNLIVAVRAILFTSVLKGVPLRGGISYGPLSVIKTEHQMNIYGKALTSAYTYENVQDWSGCVVGKECFANEESLEQLIESGLIVKYRVPKKQGSITEEFTVNWPTYMSYAVEEAKKIIETSFSEHNKSVDDWSTKRKIQNTIDFFCDMVHETL